MIAALLLMASTSPHAIAVEEVSGPGGARSQSFTMEVAAPIADLWTAFTTADGWRKWATPIAWVRSTDPLIIETSYDPKAQPDGPQTIKQQFDRVEPHKRLSFRTTKAPAHFKGFETYSKVVSDVTFEPLGPDKTRVRFVTGPFPETEDGRRLYDLFLQGNRFTLERMARVLSQESPAENH